MSDEQPWFQFRPRLLDGLRDYSAEKFFRDLLAGLTVGIVALPLAIGLGIASGVTPGAGIYTAIIGGFLVSALGGSRVQIGGPAGAFVGLVYAIIAQYGLPNLLLCTAMAGVFLFILGAARLGSLIKFVPHPVTTGFTCGIAITIILTQVKDFLGLPIETVPADFFEKIPAFARALASASGPTAAVGAGAVAIIVFWPKTWARYLPGSIVAVVLGTMVVYYGNLPVATISSRFGPEAFPDGLPSFHPLVFDWENLRHLVAPALAITVLGSIESLLSAVVADGMIDDRHDSNQELMAQGVANFTVPFFGGIPVTGVLARTATNVRNGAATPVAGIVHALTLLLVVLVAAPLAKFIPLTVLGAVLVVVAVRMGEWDEFLLLRRQSRGDAAVFLLTFGLTTCFDLTVAVKWGLILSAALFIKRIADTTQVFAHDEPVSKTHGHEPVPNLPPGVLVYRVFGALLFGAADKLDNVLRRGAMDSRVIILHLSAVTALDGTAMKALEMLHEKLRHHKKHLILSGPHTQPYFLMEKSGFLDRVGRDNVAADLDAAVVRARELVAKN
ncbi:MAG TPA: SulP family inorganic anion transporter [Opitutaceae bacterium]|nr:SulP family inorganic anion transporter [Opitutaceae bacterium]